ncbi:catalase HPII [Solitalea longa]|uniref:Catalase n=1 Tax=Solitalea longa TaxID=2079460 RepID=A0A2S5A4U6_9SPHI|nr:catalase [Solitalea longa]POY37317.1 catalase HPII [Solitalea longa]
MDAHKNKPGTDKTKSLQPDTENSEQQQLSTNQGLLINDNQNSLKAGERGPTLMEDFIFREKILHFDHERIPERVVHARGAGAHGYFELYESLKHYTKAKFLTDTSKKTPVFVRFSTVAGSRGSSDLARDVRGFAIKFYTEEGNYDLVGNNMPVFFIQDAIKFPDLIHAAKAEPDNEIPQAATAHDTFWDFISLMPESMHMIMWAMSDRAIPRSFSRMEGFGVHTFRFINENDVSTFVKFHWKPLLGVHSVAWDEAQKISGKDPDFHRRDLWDAIEEGLFPEWELGVQLVPEDKEFDFNFDLLDPTKLIPEELIPVKIIGKLTLNKNPENFFAETEQIAFHPGHLVPGIDFTNDPLLQGRLFSYTDTQLSRLGSANFHEIPINRPLAPVHNNQRDGHMRQTINAGKTSYQPNSIRSGCPFQTKIEDGGFSSYAEPLNATKIRERSKSFFDHFSQATLFFNSQSVHEKRHLINALKFELGKVELAEIRLRMLGLLSLISAELATEVAEGLGMTVPDKPMYPINESVPADAAIEDYQPSITSSTIKKSKALSMEFTVKNTIKARKIALIINNGMDGAVFNSIKTRLVAENALVKTVAPNLGFVQSLSNDKIKVDFSFLTTSSVLFDAVFVFDIENNSALLNNDLIQFVKEAYMHCKPLALPVHLLDHEEMAAVKVYAETEMGIILIKDGDANEVLEEFIKAVSAHRFWEREANF